MSARTESFPTAGPAELELHLGAGSLVVDLAEGAETVEVTVRARAASPWSGGLSGVLAALSGAAASSAAAGGAAASSAAAAPPPGPDAVAATTVSFSPGRDRLVLRAPAAGAGRTAPLDVRIAAPAGSRVLVRTSSAGVEVTGTAGSVDVSAGSGDVVVHEVRAGLDVRTGSGDVRTGLLRTGGRVRTASGDLAVDATAGDLDLVTGSGDLRIGIAAGVLAELDVRSGSGAARTELGLLDSGVEGVVAVQVTARTGSGDVVVHAGR